MSNDLTDENTFFFILRCNFLELRVSFNWIFQSPVKCPKEEKGEMMVKNKRKKIKKRLG